MGLAARRLATVGLRKAGGRSELSDLDEGSATRV
jgi:hypothetical protein